MRRHSSKEQDERLRERKGDLEAAPDDIANDVQSLESSTAGLAGDGQDLSDVEEANDESVEELAASGQALEASVVEGVEDAAAHPERPVHTHEGYGRPDDVIPRDPDEDAA